MKIKKRVAQIFTKYKFKQSNPRDGERQKTRIVVLLQGCENESVVVAADVAAVVVVADRQTRAKWVT